MVKEGVEVPAWVPLRVVVREGSTVVRVLECKVDPGKSAKPHHLKVFVSGIPAELEEETLLDLFGRFGEVTTIALHPSGTSAAVLYADPTGPRAIWKQRRNEDPIQLKQELSQTPFGLKGTFGWVEAFKAKRPGNAELQKALDAWTEEHEAEEQRKAAAVRAAAAADDGWTLVQRSKGRKRGVDDSGVLHGGVAAAAAASAAGKAGMTAYHDFYRFQKRESRQSGTHIWLEILRLREKFEEDKKRLAALRSTRKFKPY